MDWKTIVSLLAIAFLVSGVHAPAHLEVSRIPAASTLLILGVVVLGAWVVSWLLRKD